MKEMLFDMLNGLKLDQLPLFLVQMFLAAIIGFILERIYAKKQNKSIDLKVIAMTIAAVVSLIKFSVPVGIVFVGLAVLLVARKSADESEQSVKYKFIAYMLALAIGAGYSVFAVVGCIPLLALLIMEKSDRQH